MYFPQVCSLLQFLPSATQLRRLCFYRCLSAHWGGLPQCMLGYPPQEQAPPPAGGYGCGRYGCGMATSSWYAIPCVFPSKIYSEVHVKQVLICPGEEGQGLVHRGLAPGPVHTKTGALYTREGAGRGPVEGPYPLRTERLTDRHPRSRHTPPAGGHGYGQYGCGMATSSWYAIPCVFPSKI